MIRTNIYNTTSCICLLIGLGGLGGACDTGKGFVLSTALIVIGSAMEYFSDHNKKRA